MGPTNEKKSRQSLWRELCIFAAVAAFGLFSIRGEYKPSQPEPAAEKSDAPKRLLASLGPASTKSDKSTKIIEIGCLEKSASPNTSSGLKTRAALVRIMAQACGTVAEISATNESTGESLMIFRQTKKISTHYFPLKSGRNKVVIKWAGPKGLRAETVLEVEKLPAGG